MEKILLAHGSGGKLTHNLIERYFAPNLLNAGNTLDDAAVLPFSSARLAFTTDSYVVDPIFFPGGNIGDLAVNGTVNDLSMVGAKPLYLTAGFIIEEGLPLDDLKVIIQSMRRATEEAGLTIVAGDTKVVNRGKADKIFINTSGVGLVPAGLYISSTLLRPGDKILLSGSIGDHGIAVLSKREGFAFSSSIQSDTAPLNKMVEEMMSVTKDIHALRDPTRGGLATILKEFALSSQVGITIDEVKIPVKESVRGICELLGLDPLYVACEGRLVASVPAHIAEMLLEKMRTNIYGQDAAIIGEVSEEPEGMVLMKTVAGGRRIVDMLVGEQLPRIC